MTRIVKHPPLDGNPYGDRSALGRMASGPHNPDPDAHRVGHGVEPNAGKTFATGGTDRPGLRTRRVEDPPDPLGPEGHEVGRNRDAEAAEVLRQRYQTLPNGQPSGQIIYEDQE